MSIQISSSRITQEQVNQYKNEGYVLPRIQVFESAKFQKLVDHFEEKLAAWPSDLRPETMDTPHFNDCKLLEWALAPEVIDLVEPLLGPDLLLFSTHFICKSKNDGRRVPWHEDSAYWRRHLDPMEVATVWLAIDPSTTENGCMYVIPKSHNTGKKGYSDYEDTDLSKNVFGTEIISKDRKDELAVPCQLQPNECSLHDSRIQHGSPPNTSTMRRCGWTLRFMHAGCRLNPQSHSTHIIYPARGKNLLNQPLADPGRNYPEVVEARHKKGIKSH
ncbi:MAG: phytanoyl-CoA dioxygenase family protein [Verrucomicrobiota bacterium]